MKKFFLLDKESFVSDSGFCPVRCSEDNDCASFEKTNYRYCDDLRWCSGITIDFRHGFLVYAWNSSCEEGDKALRAHISNKYVFIFSRV